MSGTLYNLETFPFKMVAAKIGKLAFLEPETSSSPRQPCASFYYVVIHFISPLHNFCICFVYLLEILLVDSERNFSL